MAKQTMAQDCKFGTCYGSCGHLYPGDTVTIRKELYGIPAGSVGKVILANGQYLTVKFGKDNSGRCIDSWSPTFTLVARAEV